MSVKTLTINGTATSAPGDQTILDAARQSGHSIPTLCHMQGTSNVGACRLCLVEVSGTGRLLAACVTHVEEGISIQTDTPRLREYRRMIVELLLAERNHVCSVCVATSAMTT
jgi:bidirectional [NiFe] hydrogenase diaphorase subunit